MPASRCRSRPRSRGHRTPQGPKRAPGGQGRPRGHGDRGWDSRCQLHVETREQELRNSSPVCLGKLDQTVGFGDRLSSSPSRSNSKGFPTPLGLFRSEVEVKPCHHRPRALAPSREERKSVCTSGLTVCFLVILQRMHVRSMWPRADVMKTMKAFSWIAESTRQRVSC